MTRLAVLEEPVFRGARLVNAALEQREPPDARASAGGAALFAVTRSLRTFTIL